MNKINVGIAYEGGLDTEYISVLMGRLLAEKEFGIGSLQMVKPNTGIVGFVPAYVLSFKRNDVDLMVFVTDKDKEGNRRKQVIDAIKKTDPGALEFSAIGIPNPHIEDWVLCDENAVKSVLSLPGSAALKFSNLQPKQQLMSLHQESKFAGTLEEVKVSIAQECNLSHMSGKCPEFNAFVEDIHKVLNFLQTTQDAK